MIHEMPLQILLNCTIKNEFYLCDSVKENFSTNCIIIFFQCAKNDLDFS